LQSKLDFIFPFAYIPSQAFKEIDNDVVFYQIYQVLEELENGIRVTIGKESFTIYIVVGLILGDNLVLISILGFIKSFRAKRFCRACSETT